MAQVGAQDEAAGGGESRCPRCQALFLDARVLPCLHSLCLACLQGLEPLGTMERGQLGAQRSILCPVCDSEVALPPGGVRDLLPDMLAQAEVLLERLRSGGHDVPCHLCGDGRGERHCQDCRVIVCEFCCQAHRRQKRTADHSLVPLRDLPSGSSLCPLPYCSVHPLEELCLYCERCALPSCRDCAVTMHQGHDPRPVPEVATRHRTRLQGAVMTSEPQQRDLRSALSTVRGAEDDLQRSAAALRSEVETFIEGYIRAVQDHRLRLLRDIEEGVRRREQALGLQRARLQQKLSDLQTATSFTRRLLERGPDLHVVRAKGLALSRLQELSADDASPAESAEGGGLRFSPQEAAGLCQGYQVYGAVQRGAVTPERCQAKGQGLRSVHQGKVSSFSVICNTKSGDPLEHGGVQPRVVILHAESGRSLNPSIQDNRDGTFLVSYTAADTGQLSISVYIKGRHIKGSPFSVTVQETLRQHRGIYHCCTFCSSGGQKDARCGCGGTMPGGYQGCGHGHKGHPGRSHWSCCGSTREASECSGVRDSAPRNLLRTVAL